MVERGLIERVPAPGRAIRHRITDEVVRREGARRVTAVARGSFAGLTPDQVDQLGALLELVLQRPPDRKPVTVTG